MAQSNYDGDLLDIECRLSFFPQTHELCSQEILKVTGNQMEYEPTFILIYHVLGRYTFPAPPRLLFLFCYCNPTTLTSLSYIMYCSVLPSVIAATQRHGFSVLKELFHFTSTWCFTMHRQRMKMLGRWNY